jgi:hypothetical protein
LLILSFTLSLSYVSQIRKSGRHLDALESTDSVFYKHRSSDRTPVGEDLLSSTRVVKDGRRGTELSNLEVHTVSTHLDLTSAAPDLPGCSSLNVALEQSRVGTSTC